jgi:hypothetical protein
MPIAASRNGRAGILATVIILLSIVLFIGCLFWLSVNGPWGGGSLFGDDLFKPASMQEHEEDETQILVETEHEMNMTEAMKDLSRAGCVFTEYMDEYAPEKIISLDYPMFKEEAVERKLVFTTENSQDTPVLLITKNGKIYEWSP